ncbi:hypothetical protein D1872_222000 [compost metagenome]
MNMQLLMICSLFSLNPPISMLISRIADRMLKGCSPDVKQPSSPVEKCHDFGPGGLGEVRCMQIDKAAVVHIL